MQSSSSKLDPIFAEQLETMALTLRGATIRGYLYTARSFLSYLHASFPEVESLSELRRDPHIVGWYRHLCERQPPLSNKTRMDHLLKVRRMLNDLDNNGHHSEPNLIRGEDFPPRTQYLPRPLSPEDDQVLQEELRRTGDLLANALLLTRATGIRIGECMRLSLDCLRSLGADQWAVHVPLGKLHTERLVPADAEVRRIVARILELRSLAEKSWLEKSGGLLLPRGAAGTLYIELCRTLRGAAKRAGCSGNVTPHRLRHSYATELLRLGVGLPALMRLLGHKDVKMTLRYVQVTQHDLQREFHAARDRAAQLHKMPPLSIPGIAAATAAVGAEGVRQALESARHLLEMYRRALQEPAAQQRIQRIDKRILNAAAELDRLTTAGK